MKKMQIIKIAAIASLTIPSYALADNTDLILEKLNSIEKRLDRLESGAEAEPQKPGVNFKLHSRKSPKHKVKHLKNKLDLSDKQAENIEGIMTSAKDEFNCKELESRKERKSCVKKMKKSTNDKIASVLSPAQNEEFKAIKKRKKAKFSDRVRHYRLEKDGITNEFRE